MNMLRTLIWIIVSFIGVLFLIVGTLGLCYWRDMRREQREHHRKSLEIQDTIEKGSRIA